MDNKYGIILDSPMERYFEVDTSYYHNYIDDNSNNLHHLTYNCSNYDYTFGSILELYDNRKVIYLFEIGRFIYVSLDYSFYDIPKIIRISKDNILKCIGVLNRTDKETLLNNLEYMLDNDINVPKKGRSSLIKLLKDR